MSATQIIAQGENFTSASKKRFIVQGSNASRLGQKQSHLQCIEDESDQVDELGVMYGPLTPKEENIKVTELPAIQKNVIPVLSSAALKALQEDCSNTSNMIIEKSMTLRAVHGAKITTKPDQLMAFLEREIYREEDEEDLAKSLAKDRIQIAQTPFGVMNRLNKSRTRYNRTQQ